jgi:hypothetical protein
MVGKAANLIQIFGLDAFTLVTILTVCFWQFHEAKEECRKLEDRVRVLRQLLLSPAGCWIVQQQSLELLGHLVITNALRDADDLLRSYYTESTPFLRVLRGRAMSRQFRDLRNSIDSITTFLLLLLVQANPPPPPPPPGDSTDAETSSTAAPDHTHIVDISQE